MAWTNRGSILGPEGPEGPQGIQGETGADGGTTPHAARHATGGDDPVSPASIGASATSHTHPPALVPFAPDSFTDGTTITLDASTGSFFRGSLAGNRTLAVPTNGTDGQRLLVEALASTTQRTLTINASILRASTITSPITIPSGKRWFGGLLLSSGTWYLIASAVQG
ncbi:MAG: hypothetical protein ACRD0P_20050 [Stackebrandtia sp.]